MAVFSAVKTLTIERLSQAFNSALTGIEALRLGADDRLAEAAASELPEDASHRTLGDILADIAGDPDARKAPDTEVAAASIAFASHAAFGAGLAEQPLDNGSNAGTANVAASGDQRIDGLLSGVKWSGSSITYSDPDSVSDYQANHPEPLSDFAQLSAQQLRAVFAALDTTIYTQSAGGTGFAVEGFTNLGLAYAGAGSGAGTIRLANTSDPWTAYAYYPSTGVWGGDGFFGPSGDLPTVGNYDYHTVIHEIGHSLGLKHGQETDVYGALPYASDSMEFSVMTYKSYIGDFGSGYGNEQWGFAQTYMMYDIAALQHMYGADFTTNAGDTSYTWNPTTGQAFVNGALALSPGGNRVFETIWDGGGTDTYNLSNYGSNLVIDLTPGGFSILSSAQLAYLGGGPNGGYARGNVFNALQYHGDTRSLIENATGGSGNDSITGNAANNALSGQGGNDTLRGGTGNDSLLGDTGNDRLEGQAGNDTYYVDSTLDQVIEAAASGTDIVYSRATFTLGGNVESLRMIPGSGAINGTGNELNNELWGTSLVNTLRGLGGNDTFDSGNGADILIGGTGGDVFKYSSLAGSNPTARDIIRAGDGAVAFEAPGGGAGDRFDFSVFDANANASGVQDFTFGTSTGIARLWAVNSGSNTLIRGNVDADAAVEFELAIEDGATLASAYSSSDFLV